MQHVSVYIVVNAMCQLNRGGQFRPLGEHIGEVVSLRAFVHFRLLQDCLGWLGEHFFI